MKQTTGNSKNIMNKNANQKQVMKSKKVEANAHRKVNKSWEKVEHTSRYRSASAREVCDTITKKIEIEVLDGILLNLSIKRQTKPSSVQNRILRRIVEKRQAQANHKKRKHPTLAAFVWASSFTTFARKTLCLYSTKQMFFGFVALQ